MKDIRPTDVFFLVLIWSSLERLCLGKKSPVSPKAVIGVDGGTESIRACCFDASNGKVIGEACAVPYTTYHPNPSWAEQDPNDWYENMCEAVRGAISSLDNMDSVDICAICLDTTCCSVVALDSNKRPLRPSLLWMDQRSAPQTKEILEKCKGDPALKVNSDGEGPISAEWMTPKALWLAQNEPEIWKKADVICEYQDYLNLRLTGKLVASSCNAAARWHWDGVECLADSTKETPHPGRPISLYKKLGIPELARKLPQRCIAMGDVVGQLNKEAVKRFGLDSSIPVIQGGPDAFVGMVGLGCINPGQLCLITGSSHLHCVVSENPTTFVGTWGAYKGAPLSNINFAEGGQSSTGSIARWAKNLFGQDFSYQELDKEAEQVRPGADGLVALETFQGSRTPVTDPLARGALVGLTLSHERGNIWRALLEAVCFGTRACVDGLGTAGHTCDEIIMAGGATRSPFWLQLHADITGKPIVVCENKDAPLLGCAILASVGVGVHSSVSDAVAAMVRTSQRVEPNPSLVEEYSTLYEKVYSKVGKSLRDVSHSLDAIRRQQVDDHEKDETEKVVISPSLLACDWSDIKGEVGRCLDAGAVRLHVDVFDGVFIKSPLALTFGPQMVAAIRDSCKSSAKLDCHVCVESPSRYVKPLSEAGASTFIFQMEAMKDAGEAIELAKSIIASGMQVGVSINPATDVSTLYPLLRSGLVSVVDVLAVEAGFGGQAFQKIALKKIQAVRKWGQTNDVRFDIMVDGGVNQDTAREIIEAGAQILVAGTFLFEHDSVAKGVQQLQNESRTS